MGEIFGKLALCHDAKLVRSAQRNAMLVIKMRLFSSKKSTVKIVLISVKVYQGGMLVIIGKVLVG